jgi:methylthioribose-1-phosphate isomerase
MSQLPHTIRWNSGELYFLDQTKLPHKVVEEKQENVEVFYQQNITAQPIALLKSKTLKAQPGI